MMDWYTAFVSVWLQNPMYYAVQKASLVNMESAMVRH